MGFLMTVALHFWDDMTIFAVLLSYKPLNSMTKPLNLGKEKLATTLPYYRMHHCKQYIRPF